MNKTAIKNLLAQAGISGVVTTKRLADALKMSVRTVNGAKNKGDLRQIDRNTFDTDSIVDWLFRRPRYLNRMEAANMNQGETA